MKDFILRRYRIWPLLATAILIMLTLSGCSTMRAGPTPTPTRTPRPTFTRVPPTALPTDVPPTAIPSPLPPPTETPTPEATAVTPAIEPPDTAPQTTEPAVTAPTVTRQPAAATPAPTVARPTAPPAVLPTAPPPTTAPAPSDPCAGIGGDGCKWRVTGGPAFADTGGQEIKLQLMFLHSGIEGGQPQGSYFVVLEKDGQRLPIPDSVRSIAGAANQGALGAYNYEYALGVGQLPGNTVAGNYTLWVLDGNGERDSSNITFSVPDGLGLIWIKFDQA